MSENVVNEEGESSLTVAETEESRYFFRKRPSENVSNRQGNDSIDYATFRFDESDTSEDEGHSPKKKKDNDEDYVPNTMSHDDMKKTVKIRRGLNQPKPKQPIKIEKATLLLNYEREIRRHNKRKAKKMYENILKNTLEEVAAKRKKRKFANHHSVRVSYPALPAAKVQPVATVLRNAVNFFTLDKFTVPAKPPPKPVWRRRRKRCSFLASLFEKVLKDRAHPRARLFKLEYQQRKHDLVKELFTLYNAKVFNNMIPEDLPITWSDEPGVTAGSCVTIVSNRLIVKKIILYSVLVDRPERLAVTLMHEMCHAANVIEGGVQYGHSAEWTKWVDRAVKIFPELNPILPANDYDIIGRYSYVCSNCTYHLDLNYHLIHTDVVSCGLCRMPWFAYKTELIYDEQDQPFHRFRRIGPPRSINTDKLGEILLSAHITGAGRFAVKPVNNYIPCGYALTYPVYRPKKKDRKKTITLFQYQTKLAKKRKPKKKANAQPSTPTPTPTPEKETVSTE